MMTSGQNISHYTTAKLSLHVWNLDLIWWQNKIDTQRHFHKTTITSSWTLSKTKIPITIVKAQMPSNPNQKSRTRDNDSHRGWRLGCSKTVPLWNLTRGWTEVLLNNLQNEWGILSTAAFLTCRRGRGRSGGGWNQREIVSLILTVQTCLSSYSENNIK